MAEAERAWRQALSYAERGGFGGEGRERQLALDQRDLRPAAGGEGIARWKEFAEPAADEPTIAACCCGERSVLEAMRGDFDLARRLLADGSRSLDDLGLNVGLRSRPRRRS